MVWEEEGKYPNVIVEVLSDKTASIDKGLKKQLYQDTFRTPEYFWFDPISLEFKGFHLVDGQYEDIPPTDEKRLRSRQLELYLGVHEGKLRFFTTDNELIPSAEERAERLASRLRELGEDPTACHEFLSICSIVVNSGGSITFKTLTNNFKEFLVY